MAIVAARFDQFEVGDYTALCKTFTLDEFTAFSSISGDSNALHHDVEVAAASDFGRPIVPLHMIIAPLSRIAGMVFPGNPSLYISHDVKALLPVFYDEEITYSARITAINRSHRVLSIDVLGFRRNEVVFTAAMKVQAREATWEEAEGICRYPSNGSRTALITGASGAIGAAIALNLARHGYRLLLHGNTNEAALATLASQCESCGAAVKLLRCPLENEQSAHELGEWCVAENGLSLVIHAASPPLHSDLHSLVAVNYTALRILVGKVTPHFLKRQSGTLVFVSSSAVESHPVGWEDYVGAKSMAASLVSGFNQKYSQYGPRGVVVAPGYVKSKFSSGLFSDSVPAMLPEEVAEGVCDCLFGARKGKAYYVIRPHGIEGGQHGFRAEKATQMPSGELGEALIETDQKGAIEASDISTKSEPSDKLGQLLREFLRLSPDDDIEQAALGVTAGWDSLRHIELLLLLESEFALSFTTDEINQAQDYPGIRDLLHAKLKN